MQKMKANDQMAAFMSEAAKIRRPEDRIVAIIAEYDLAALGKPDLSQDLDEPSPRQKLMQGIRNRLKRELTIREILLHFREDKRISHIIDLALHERERNAYEERRAAHALPHIVTDEERHELQAARHWLFGELKYIHQTAIANFGAAAALQMQGATMLGGHAFPDEDETLLDLHLDTLIKMIPKECKRRLDTMLELGEHKKALQIIMAQTAPKKHISFATAAKIWATLSLSDAPTDDTVSNWVRAGHLAKHPNVLISENDLATKASFVQWLLSAFESMGKGKHTPTQAQMSQIIAL